jgi:hypothetical protein
MATARVSRATRASTIIQIADDAPAPCTSSTGGAPSRRSPRSA